MTYYIVLSFTGVCGYCRYINVITALGMRRGLHRVCIGVQIKLSPFLSNWVRGVLAHVNPQTRTLDFRGFDSVGFWIPRGGNPRSEGRILQVWTQRFLRSLRILGMRTLGEGGFGARPHRWDSSLYREQLNSQMSSIRLPCLTSAMLVSPLREYSDA